jgi:hypothetical protein
VKTVWWTGEAEAAFERLFGQPHDFLPRIAEGIERLVAWATPSSCLELGLNEKGCLTYALTIPGRITNLVAVWSENDDPTFRHLLSLSTAPA